MTTSAAANKGNEQLKMLMREVSNVCYKWWESRRGWRSPGKSDQEKQAESRKSASEVLG